MPVLAHLDGICHVYIDADADRDKAHRIAFNAKTQRYGTCNTMETLLVARARADMLPELVAALQLEGVEVRGCEASRQAAPDITIDAVEEDWSTEYLAPILSIKLVENAEEAMSHIAQYGSNHTESIVTENASTAERFLREWIRDRLCTMLRPDSPTVLNMVSARKLASPPASCMRGVLSGWRGSPPENIS